jgi:hypothetical protein
MWIWEPGETGYRRTDETLVKNIRLIWLYCLIMLVKLRIFTAFFFTAILISVLTDKALSQTVAIGGRGGATTTWLLNKDLKDDMLLSIAPLAGLNVTYYYIPQEYYNDNIYGIQLEFVNGIHLQKWKGKILDDSVPFNYERTVRMKYLDIPLMFRFSHDRGGTFIEVGPEYSILLSAEEDLSETRQGSVPYKAKDIKDRFHENNLSAVLGFGIDFSVSAPITIHAGVRTSYSLEDIRKSEKGIYSSLPLRRATAGINIGVFYKFNYYHSNKAK